MSDYDDRSNQIQVEFDRKLEILSNEKIYIELYRHEILYFFI